jgi:hypothetical protein
MADQKISAMTTATDLVSAVLTGIQSSTNKQFPIALFTALLIGGSLGSTDNAVLRADGTGGKTAQGSAMVVDDNGHVTAFGGKIFFPASQAADAGANVMDDYEEGSSTPALQAGTGTVTSASIALSYTKVGNRLSWQAEVTVTTNGTGATYSFFALPFTPAVGSGIGASTSGGIAVAAQARPDGNVYFWRYDGAYIPAGGMTIYLSGNYRV